ncbi:MAG: glycoside hydrolase family 99-like domain-containing protein [Eubacteriales bacterium]|jgi:hypothetical protein|nr:glycoside hydrolase family 99-like domain-containing protein [Eubacteriales bacterium]
MKLGAYYWDGWYDRIPHWTDRLLSDFTEREPVWGWLGNTVVNMELQIDYAADAGLSYFAFDWYYPEHGHINRMNEAVDRYLASQNAGRMEFCLLVANHSGGFIYRDKWDDACDMFMPYLTDKNALCVNGCPVIIFFSTGDLIRCLGGADETKICLDRLRERIQAAGFPGVYVIGCGGPPRDDTGEIVLCPGAWRDMINMLESCGLDAVTGYNYHRNHIKNGDEISYIYPYEKLVNDHIISRNAISEYCRLPQMPLIIGGWDCRPWETVWKGRSEPHPRSCYSPDRTPTDVYNHVLETGKWIEANSGKVPDKLAIVYAWNENGEGGYIEPTVGDRGAILNAVRRALEDVNR